MTFIVPMIVCTLVAVVAYTVGYLIGRSHGYAKGRADYQGVGNPYLGSYRGEPDEDGLDV